MNVGSKINRLPNEILVEILLLCEQKTRRRGKYPYILSLVCRRWKELIDGSAVFWSTIHFSPWRGEEPIQQLVARSRSAQLTVFSPLDEDLDNIRGPRRSSQYINDIITTFNQLIETEGHRIKYLSLTGDFNRKSPGVLSGKKLPATKTFILDEERGGWRTGTQDEEKIIPILKSAKCLEYLSISLSTSSSLSELDPSFFHCLRGLNIRLHGVSVTRQFLDYVSFCSNLQSLTLVTLERHLLKDEEPLHLPFTVVLPNLLCLRVNYCRLIDQIRAPALRRLRVDEYRPSQQNYLIFDEYDISSLTGLSISEEVCNSGPSPTIWIRGSARSITWQENLPRPSFRTFEDAYNPEVDLAGGFSLSSIIPVLLFIQAPTYYTSPNGKILPGSGNSFLAKVLPKLHNLEVLCCMSDRRSLPFPSLLQPLRHFFKEIFDNLVSMKLRWLIIKEPINYPAVLRFIFSTLNEYLSLSNLSILSFRYEYSMAIGDDFGKALINFLRKRRAKGYQPLQKVELEGYSSLPEKWVAEAATLGTQVIELPPVNR